MIKRFLPLLSVLFFASRAQAGPDAPSIRHRPLQSAAQGQSMSIRAQVTSPAYPLTSVTLYFTTSSDSAPVKIPLRSTSANNIWAGTIPADFIKGHKELNYYIAAENDQGLTAETPWYKVKLLSITEQPVTRTSTRSTAPVHTDNTSGNDHSWVKPALIAGGAVAVVGGIALAVSGGGGGGGSSDDNSPDPDPASDTSGTYAGSVTTCYTSSDTDCETHMIAITISNDGYATSDTLAENQFLRGSVSGNEFRFMAEVSNTDRTGEIIFTGTILEDRIVGSVSGSATESSGENGTYSGTFNAVRQ